MSLITFNVTKKNIYLILLNITLKVKINIFLNNESHPTGQLTIQMNLNHGS